MKTVLVIEDQKPVRESIGDLLEMAGCKTRLIGDGQAALELLLETSFDMVTLDLNMPSLDGISLLETLAAQKGPNSKTPIVVISAYLSPQTSEILRQFGIMHCLPKPFETEELLAIVRSILTP